MSKKKLLITGPLGHIGSKFIHSLGGNKNIGDVILLDNLSTLRYPSLFNLPPGINFRFIEGDILNYDLAGVLDDVDIVLHLAAITDAASSFQFEERVMEVNYAGTKRVAGECAKRSVDFIFISTTSVYGTQDDIVDENCSDEDLKPQSPYATSKLKAENALFELKNEYPGFRFVICRFGTIFGTSVGMRFHTAINKFTWQAVMNEPVSVWKTALNQKRPYLSLYDAIKALHFIIANDCFNSTVYNVLSVNCTVDEILSEIKNHVPDLEIRMVESKIMNQLSYNVSNEKFRKLGFKFEGSLSEIKETYDLLKNANSNL